MNQENWRDEIKSRRMWQTSTKGPVKTITWNRNVRMGIVKKLGENGSALEVAVLSGDFEEKASQTAPSKEKN